MRPKGITDLHVLWAIRDVPFPILNLAEKSVLYSFAAIIGNKKICDLSFPELVEIMCASERALRNYFKSLEKKKFLVVKRSNKLARGKTNKYQLNYGLILSFSNTANSALIKEINTANSAAMEKVTRQISSQYEADSAGASIEREERYKSREGSLSLIVNENHKGEEQKMYDRKDFAFTPEEMESSYRRDIQIQLCFNKFMEWLESKGRSKFSRLEWSKWFDAERSGKNAKHTPPPAKNEHLEKVMAEHEKIKEQEKFGMPDYLKPEWEKVRAKLKGQRVIDTN